MMMNRKDVEAYQKSYEKIDIFLKQFPHLKDTVLGELKNKSGKNLFRKLNEHSKKLQAKQEEIMKKHNSLAAEHDELEHLKNNMKIILVGIKRIGKKIRLLVQLRNIKEKQIKQITHSHSMNNDMEL